ncbi:dsDNA nuclease domain-containing protein [Baileyella intestinalis]|uniref:dsDNA nuclease domain-containing protein n=1 Tax=Baileyella intestinalis TaxID=2606709 RepID=UPI003A886C08
MEEHNIVKVDMTSGSRSYNRFELQMSQSLHMALQLYDEVSFLLIMDHYDDITIFDLDSEPLAVSYYQVKTSDHTVTIDSVIKNEWISKLYEQIKRPNEWVIKELGLITNVPITISLSEAEDGEEKRHKVNLTAPRTAFSSLYSTVQKKIKADIADRCKVPIDSIDLSKFAHLHTTLTIERHRDLVEQEIGNFLYDKYPEIRIDTVKAIYGTVIDILTRQQSNERIPENASFEDVKKYKGFSKNEFQRIINKAILFSIPQFETVLNYIGIGMNDNRSMPIGLAYSRIINDSGKRGNEAFSTLFNKTVEKMRINQYEGSLNAWKYAQTIDADVRKENPMLCVPYTDDYIAVLVICLMINMSRAQISLSEN